MQSPAHGAFRVPDEPGARRWQVCVSINSGGGCGGMGLTRVLVGTFLVRVAALSLGPHAPA